MNIVIKLAIEDLQKKMGEDDVYTENFFFNAIHAEQRSARALVCPNLGRRSYLSLLIRECMNAELRKIIFPSKYRLGNNKLIPVEQRSLEKLADELLGESRWATASDILDTVKIGIEKITNKKYEEHSKNNKSKALKVVHALYLIMKSRNQRIFQLLARPEEYGKYSMSFRDAYPYKNNEEQSWLISDLKSYLSAELKDKKFFAITSTFENLIPWTNGMNIFLEASISSLQNATYEDSLTHFQNLTNAVRDFKFKCTPRKAALDAVMFSHICSLESAHFLVGYQEVVQLAIPEKKLHPIMHEIYDFEQKIASLYTTDNNQFDLIIPLSKIIDFTAEYDKEIKSIVRKAMQERYTEDYFKKLPLKVLNLLSSFHLLKNSNIPAVVDQSGGVDLLDLITSYCSVIITEEEQPKFKPYWSGQAAQGGSLKESTKPFTSSLDSLTENAPEEHRLYWVTRFEWCRYALRGMPELIEQIYDFRSATASLALKICNTSDKDCISRIQDRFVTYIEKYLADNGLNPILAIEPQSEPVPTI